MITLQGNSELSAIKRMRKLLKMTMATALGFAPKLLEQEGKTWYNRDKKKDGEK